MPRIEEPFQPEIVGSLGTPLYSENPRGQLPTEQHQPEQLDQAKKIFETLLAARHLAAHHPRIQALVDQHIAGQPVSDAELLEAAQAATP